MFVKLLFALLAVCSFGTMVFVVLSSGNWGGGPDEPFPWGLFAIPTVLFVFFVCGVIWGR